MCDCVSDAGCKWLCGSKSSVNLVKVWKDRNRKYSSNSTRASITTVSSLNATFKCSRQVKRIPVWCHNQKFLNIFTYRQHPSKQDQVVCVIVREKRWSVPEVSGDCRPAGCSGEPSSARACRRHVVLDVVNEWGTFCELRCVAVYQQLFGPSTFGPPGRIGQEAV